MEEEKIELAIEIITDQLSKLLDKYAHISNKEESKFLKEKIDVLEKIQNELYQGNIAIANNIIDKKKKGIL